MDKEIKINHYKKPKDYLNEINQLVTQIVGINDKELSAKACKILNRRHDLLFSVHIDNDYHIQIDDIVVNSLKTIIYNYMETKELKITPPEGYEIDKENSTFDCIKFKPVVNRWRDTMDYIGGYYINDTSKIIKTSCGNNHYNHNVFATKKQAKSALAMAQISQIMANDGRFGGIVTDEEWENAPIDKFVINRVKNTINKDTLFSSYEFLAFHTREQRDLFLKENEDLIKDYLMID